jgi:phage baseplate assembly protein W
MIGVDNTTGKELAGLAHLRQSITDILTTPLGGRVMRRDYGSRLFELVDAPTNQATLIDVYAATGEALDKWEPRFKLTRVFIDAVGDDGKMSLTLQGIYLPNGKEITLDGIIL